MKLSELISLCEPFRVIPKSYPEMEVNRLQLDSRKVEEGDAYIALKGTKVNGHEFVHGAMMKGAKVVIVSRLMESLGDVIQVVVKDPRSVAGKLFQAFAGYPAENMKIIGITGTNGKTTVSTLVYQALTQNNVPATLIGTIDTIIGDERRESRLTTPGPDELAEILRESREKGVTHVVMETSSHALQQKRTEGLNFHVAAFTNFTHDHLDYHRDAGEYLAAKRRLFDRLGSGSYAVVNSDDSKAKDILGYCQGEIINAGLNSGDARLIKNDSTGIGIKWQGEEIYSPLIGSFNASNVLIAASVLHALGWKPDQVAGTLAKCYGAAGRLEPVGRGNPVVLVDYAHTPDALENVLKAIADVKDATEQLIVVFGCGGDRDTTKRPQMGRIAERFGDRLYVTSDNPRTEDPQAIIDDIIEGLSAKAEYVVEPDRRKAIALAIEEAPEESIILIAGKGHETYQEVHGERLHMDDRKEARNALKRRFKETGKEVR